MEGRITRAALALVAAGLLTLSACLRVSDDEGASARQAMVSASLANPTASAVATEVIRKTPEPSATAGPDATGTPTVATTPATTGTPAVTPTIQDPYYLLFPSGGDEDEGAEEEEGANRRNNIINMVNRKDGRLRFKGRVQLNRIDDPSVTPLNQAIAYASCTDCQTYAIALQLDVVGREVTNFQPVNVALAVNYKCTRCHTVARAVQFVRQVDDPREVPRDVREEARRLDRELKRLHSRSNRMSAADVDAEVNAVIAQFRTLAQSKFEESRDEERREDSDDEKVRRRRD